MKTPESVPVSRVLLAASLTASAFLLQSETVSMQSDNRPCEAPAMLNGQSGGETMLQPFGPPPSPDLAPSKGDASHQYLGTVIFREGKMEIDAPALPSQYLPAIEYSLDDPLTACTFVNHTKGIGLYSWDEKDNGMYRQGDGWDRDWVNLKFATAPRSNTIFESYKNMSALLMHEGVHALSDEIRLAAKAGDQGAREHMRRLNAAYSAEMRIKIERYRIDKGQNKLDYLNYLQQRFSAAGEKDSADVAELMRQKFITPNGLDDVASFCISEEIEWCLMNSFEDMIGLVAQKHGKAFIGPISMDRLGVDTATLRAYNEEQIDYMQKMFPASDESEVLGLYSGMGHPSSSTTEYISSVLTADQKNPDAALTALRALPAEDRERAVLFRRVVVAAMQYSHPDIAKYLITPHILAKL